MDKIIIKGARENNLKNINIEIPKNKLVVMTGVSGSGKSSLAFDTIYAEGQRRYVESLSATAAAIPEPIKAQKNGKRYFKLTPNKAGSVIPRSAETPAEEARLFVLEFLVKNQMANVAAP